MELSYREKTTKYLIYCLLLAAAALFQNVLAVRLELFGARCFIAVPAALLIALGEHEWPAALLGMLTGAMLDMYSAQQMGYSCIFLMLACYLCAALTEYLFRHTFLFSMIACLSLLVFYVLIYWIFFVLVPSKEGAGYVLARFYLPCLFYTAAVTPLLWAVFRPLERKLNKQPLTEF